MPATPASASKQRTAKSGLDSFAREELMASLSLTTTNNNPEGGVQQQQATTSPGRTSKLSLSQLPYEIKQWIVYWVNLFEELEEPFDSDDSDVEEVDDDEFTDKPPSRKSPQKILTRSQADKQPSPPPPESALKSSATRLNSILALSLVDRTFYEICRPFIWQTIDLEDYDLSKLRELRTEFLPRHAECVRRIWWRVSITELDTYEPEGWMSASESEEGSGRRKEWSETGRSTELLGILQMCTKTTSLDVDLRPAELDEHQEFIVLPREPTAKFLAPIAQMSQLTSIALTAPANGLPFSEAFLVRLIRDMAGLQSFTCCSIDAQAPDFEHSQSITTCESPLALHLSKLGSLKELDLDQADCFDLSWSTIEWAGSLENLALDDCCRASLNAIHAFSTKFSKTLFSLELSDVPFDEEVYEGGPPTRTIAELETGLYKFSLPELTTLSISNELPIGFLEAFEECKKIKLVELAVNPSISASDIERLVNHDSWPQLEKVIIATADAELSDGQIEALELFFLSKGVLLEIDSDSDDDNDDDDDDDDDDDEQIGYAFEDEIEDMQNEWMAEDDDEF